MRLEFPKLFNYATIRSATIAEYWAGGEWIIPFRRTFGADDLVAWEQLLDKLRGVRLQGSKDYPIWILEKSGSYSTRSMYRFLSHRGVINKRMERLWKSKLPLKLKIFMWLAIQGRIQTGVALKQKNWKGDVNCNLCASPETVNHVLFQCVMARFVWASFKEALGWDRVPTSLTDIFDHWIPLGCKDYELKLFTFVIIAWALWVSRNKIRIQKCFPDSPISILYKTKFFMQRWAVLLRATDREKLATCYSSLETWVKSFEELRPHCSEDWWS